MDPFLSRLSGGSAKRLGPAVPAALALAVGLALAAAGRGADEPAPRDIARARPPAEPPWLRLNVGGHTAAVRGLAFTPDSKRLCSAGLDKIVQVWNLAAVSRDLKRTFLRERTIRWQVARGLRGSIYALDAASSDGLLAIGGYGAMGALGEILLVRPVDGSLVQVLEGHRQTVCSLAFSADGNWLASSDAAGRSLLWNRAGWQARTLVEPDATTYPAATMRHIESQPKLRPIAILGNSQALVPVCIGPQANGRLGWKLRAIDLAAPGPFRTHDVLHHGMVTALAASPDGARWASADLTGKLWVWEREGGAQELKPGAVVLSLAFSPDGRTLVAGTAVSAASSQSQLQIWDLATRALRRSRALPDHVQACRISPDGKDVAYAGGKDHEVCVERLDAPQATATLRGSGRRLLKVAFARNEPHYRLAIGSTPRQRGFNDYAEPEQTFDPLRSELGSAPANPAEWLPTEWLQGNWSARLQADGGIQLYRDNQPQGRIALDPLLEGRPRCYTWVGDGKGPPQAIAVGTDVQNSVYVYRLAATGACPILRHFRGHHDYVTSLGVSRDLRYLASASADGTVMCWSLAALDPDGQALGRWGAVFALRDGQLVATHVQPAGPLFLKGLRAGDTVQQIRWYQGQEERTENRPEQALERLRTLPWFTQVVFETARRGARQPVFQLVPAWAPLATLFVSADGEWAWWTPQGYYDASVNGYTLFGWQVNRGLQTLPDFYRADQFRKKLERPDVMQRLLPAGSLEAAFEAAQAAPPADPQQVLPEQIAATPRVEILSPRPGEVVRDNATRVRARIRLPATAKLLQAKVFANGVAATRAELIQERAEAQQRELLWDWDVRLPSDAQSLIQLVVGTDAPTAAMEHVLVERPPGSPQPKPGRLAILAMGINRYRDPEIQPLSFAVADAEAVSKTLRERAAGLYEIDRVEVLINQAATRAAWRNSLQQTLREWKERAQPDDLLVLFFAGHGIVDPKTSRYYYVGHDFHVASLEQGDFSACVSWDDLGLVADVPCRKLVLLDTCHSGAIQPLRSENLKTAIRALQEDVIFTFSASAGQELSAEKKSWGHGAFTKCLLESLEGQGRRAVGDPVLLNDVVRYVRRQVAELTAGRQNPVAAPDELLPFTSLRLATRRE